MNILHDATPPTWNIKFQPLSVVDIENLISWDEWMMETLRIVERLGLPDWYVGAGFVRNMIWDVLHNHLERTPLDDIDVIYFDPSDLSLDKEKEIEERLRAEDFKRPWSTKNQARMHIRNGEEPYMNSVDAISRWPETATCIGAKLSDGQVVIEAPHGIADLISLVIRPSPTFESKLDVYRARVQSKNWNRKWPKLSFVNV